MTKGIYVLLGLCLNNWAEGEKDEDKSHDHSPGQHHVSVVHFKICIKEKLSSALSIISISTDRAEKIQSSQESNAATMIAGQSSCKGSQQWLSGQSLC